VNNSTLFYLTNLLIYFGVDALACLGLSQQYGIAGVTNFAFIIFQAAGAYTAAILSLPPDTANGGFQLYLGGWNLPFPIPWIGATVVGGLLALPFTFLVGRRLRGDFAAIGLLVTAVVANLLVTNYRPFLNGDAGLSLIPAPLQDSFDPQSASYQIVYSAGAIALALIVYRFLRRITESPYGRTLRAMRDNDVVADSLGKNLLSLRTTMLVLGGAIAGLSGAVLVGFISTWAPAAWTYAETIVLFAAVIIGGAGNHRGAIVGAILVPLGFEEATRFIPAVGRPGLIPALQWVAVGLLIVVFLWFRPQGLLPERRRVPSGAGRAGRHGLPAAAVPRQAGDQIRLGKQGKQGKQGRPQPATGPRGGKPASRAVAASTATARVRAAGQKGQEGRARRGEAAMLEAVDLTRTFDGVAAVDGVSFTVARGRLTGLIGPNGAGKSTLLGMLAGTIPVSSGTVRYRGEDITSMPAFRRARAGLVRTFQLASEFKRLTVLENLLAGVPGARGDSFRGAVLGRGYWGADESAAITRAHAMLERFGLADIAHSYAGELSGGQRRLVEIMRALMAQPEVLLLDEPMAGVHRNLARTIGDELRALCAEGMTILMVEHELAIMDEFCDPVVVMAEGTILAEGTMASLRGKAEVVEAYLVG
jgi:branched-chain amino acid transport system permease protein